ncbi:heterokaryon incompatibility protein-domain-containing protein [Phaeosphaeria sp. MPI-PUGE-AT-0046c]|nr:heterokaryon incompatibility protein-domain-containing protein [Phaeosphaeria sp. MPI-PUGE-AT-0046c]
MTNSLSVETLGSARHNETTYKYTPLDSSSTQFRIFTLLPSLDQNAPLEGTLRVEAFHGKDDRTRPYEALSYVWGTKDDNVPLFVEGGTHIMITRNLDEALRYIRQPSQSRKLWIDALCIDQDAPYEKNHQVRQMYQTFASASRVIIWLGGADGNSEYALTHLDSLRSAPRQNLARIATIFQRPWSTRIWTLQEALAANTESIVVCGKTTVPWQSVLQALKDLLHRSENYPKISLHRLRSFMEVHTLHKTQQRLTLDKLILASSDREATDPRDYVYALLGLVNDDMFEGTDPDYTQSVTRTFQRAMFSISKSRQDLTILASGLILKRSIKYSSLNAIWATWCVPTQKYAFQELDNHFLNRRLGVVQGGAAAGRVPAEVSYLPEIGSLKTTGVLVGTVNECVQVAIETKQWNSTGFQRTIRMKGEELASLCCEIINTIEWVRQDLTKKIAKTWTENQIYSKNIIQQRLTDGAVWQLVANGRHLEHVLDRAPVPQEIYSLLPLIAKLETASFKRIVLLNVREDDPPLHGKDQFPEILSSAGKTQLISHLESRIHQKLRDPKLRRPEYSHQAFFTSHDHPRGLNGHVETAWDALWRLITKHLPKTCIFTVSEGFVGSGSKLIRRGDVLCILLGSKVPVVMRQGESGRYQIIEAVYVDGLMGGEYFADGNPYTLRDFVIE